MTSDAERRLLELQAARALYGDVLDLSPSTSSTLGSYEAGQLQENAVDINLSGSLLVQAEDAELELRFVMAPGYPSSGPLIASVHCANAATGPGPDLMRNTNENLMVALSGLVGQESLYEIACLAEGALREWVDARASSSASTGHVGAARANPTSEPATSQRGQADRVPDTVFPRALTLIRIDHMHDRRGYSRNIKKFATGLGLAGRLIFFSSRPIILLLLEGTPEELREYLRLHRTQTVDVDSAGRACRERMMDVILEAAPLPLPPEGLERRPLSGFSEVSGLTSADQVVALLTDAGVGLTVARGALGL